MNPGRFYSLTTVVFCNLPLNLQQLIEVITFQLCVRSVFYKHRIHVLERGN